MMTPYFNTVSVYVIYIFVFNRIYQYTFNSLEYNHLLIPFFVLHHPKKVFFLYFIILLLLLPKQQKQKNNNK